MRRLRTWLWPTWPGLALPGFWAAYVACVGLGGGLPGWRAVLVALWPALPLYGGACLLGWWGRRGANPRLWALLATALVLAAADLAVKAWIEARLPYQEPQPLLPGLLAINRTHNVYGTMLRIPNAVPYVSALALALVPISILGYRYYLQHEQPVVWGHAAFVGFLAAAIGKAGDLLWRGLIVDYLAIPGLPIADLADVYLIWVGGGCVLAASFCYPETWPDLRKLFGRR